MPAMLAATPQVGRVSGARFLLGAILGYETGPRRCSVSIRSLSNGSLSKMIEGGDKRTPRAKVDIAKREQQIVALKLRGIAAPEIARVIGISDRAVRAAFNKALRRQTEDALDDWHRTELGGLAMEATNIWRLMDLPENKNDWRAQAALEDRLMRIHIRRAKLLGLDAPTKLDVTGIYQRGGADIAAEQMARDAIIEALPIEEQRRIYELFYQAGLRAKAGDLSQPAIDTTVSNGSDSRTTSDDESESDPQ